VFCFDSISPSHFYLVHAAIGPYHHCLGSSEHRHRPEESPRHCFSMPSHHRTTEVSPRPPNLAGGLPHHHRKTHCRPGHDDHPEARCACRPNMEQLGQWRPWPGPTEPAHKAISARLQLWATRPCVEATDRMKPDIVHQLSNFEILYSFK
jgi:hypothetical protein